MSISRIPNTLLILRDHRRPRRRPRGTRHFSAGHFLSYSERLGDLFYDPNIYLLVKRCKYT